jgi:hypothetical protein
MQSMVPARACSPGPDRDQTEVDTEMRFRGRGAGLNLDSCDMPVVNFSSGRRSKMVRVRPNDVLDF